MIGKKPLIVSLVLTFTLVGILVLIWPVSAVEAGPGLPPRDKPPSNQEGGSNDGGSDSNDPAGAHIELYVEPVRGELWAAVQWQDSAGAWRDVEGWRGAVDAAGSQRWWVAPKDFGSGPFRWAVSSEPSGKSITASPPFYLPGQPNDVVRVEITVE